MNYNKLKNIVRDEFVLKNMLLFFLLYDFLIKGLVIYNVDFIILYRYIIIFKVFIILLIFRRCKIEFNNFKYKIPILILSICYIVSQISFYKQLDTDNILFNGYYYLSSVIPLVFFSLYLLRFNNKIIKHQIKVFLYFIAINSFFILLGYFFENQIFKSYFFRGDRYGFQGLLLFHSESGYLYFIAINLAYHLYKKYKNFVFGFLVIFLLITSFIIGTKKASFLSIIFLIYFLIDNLRSLNKKSSIYILAGLLTFLLLIKNSIISLFYKQFYLFQKIYEEEDFLSSFLSYRNVLFRKKFMPYIEENWSVLNYIFGGPTFSDNRVELELFDLILFFGLLGIISYFIVFKILLKSANKTIYFIVFSLIFASFFSGNLLSSINVMIVLFITISYLKTDKINYSL